MSIRRAFPKLAFIALLLAATAPTDAPAQVPPPIDLGIQNIPQERPVWCWAAVAQQIIYHRRGATPQQCALVAMANNAPPAVCCSGYNPACDVTGSNQQIIGLIGGFGAGYTYFAPPTDPMTLYNTLASGRPVIAQIQTGLISFHVVVIRGMFFTPTFNGLQPMLLINDPLNHFTQPVPFFSILPVWTGAFVVN